MNFIIKMPVIKMLYNILPSCIAGGSMFVVLFFPATENVLVESLYVLFAAIIYVAVIYLFQEEREMIRTLPKILSNR